MTLSRTSDCADVLIPTGECLTCGMGENDPIWRARDVFFKAHPDLIGRDILTRDLMQAMLHAADVVPRSDLDELHRELGLIQQLQAEVERLREIENAARNYMETQDAWEQSLVAEVGIEIAAKAIRPANLALREALASTRPAGGDTE